MTKRRKPVPPVKPDPDAPRVIEAFTNPDWNLSQLARFDAPSCFNGIVSVRRYRVTVERVAEPVEVIHERLLKLWRECDNHHHMAPLRATAAEYGLDLDWQEFGRDRRRPR